MVKPGEAFINESAVGDSLNPYNYNLEILTIVNNEGHAMDVRNMMGECRIYESILNNFLMGELAIVDALVGKSLFDQIKFTGQESLRIKFKHGDETTGNESIAIDKLFRIYKVSDVQRQSQGQQVYTLSFCSPEFLTSRRFRINKVYRGSHAGVAAKIGVEYLNIQMPPDIEVKDTSGANSEMVSAISNPGGKGIKTLEPYWEAIALNGLDENYQFVIPNWTVNYTMNWLCQNATESTEVATDHSSFDSTTFWFESAHGGYKIQSLRDMLKVKCLGGEKFIYSPVSEDETIEKNLKIKGKDGAPDTTEPVKVAGQKIINFQEGSHADFLEGIVYGMFGGEQTTVDFRNKTYHETDFSFFNQISDGMLIPAAEGEGSSTSMMRPGDEIKWIGESVDIVESGEVVGAVQGVGETKEFKPTSKPLHDTELRADEFKQAYSVLEYQTPQLHEDIKYNSEGNNLRQGADIIPKGYLVKQAINKLLKYNTISAQISARTDISAGTMIEFDIPSPDTGLTLDAGKGPQDPWNAGAHLITEVMWSLMPTELKTNVTCMRDSVLTTVEKEFFGEQSWVEKQDLKEVEEKDGDAT